MDNPVHGHRFTELKSLRPDATGKFRLETTIASKAYLEMREIYNEYSARPGTCTDIDLLDLLVRTVQAQLGPFLTMYQMDWALEPIGRPGLKVLTTFANVLTKLNERIMRDTNWDKHPDDREDLTGFVTEARKIMDVYLCAYANRDVPTNDWKRPDENDFSPSPDKADSHEERIFTNFSIMSAVLPDSTKLYTLSEFKILCLAEIRRYHDASEEERKGLVDPMTAARRSGDVMIVPTGSSASDEFTRRISRRLHNNREWTMLTAATVFVICEITGFYCGTACINTVFGMCLPWWVRISLYVGSIVAATWIAYKWASRGKANV